MFCPGVLSGAREPHHWIRPEEEKQLAVMIQKEMSGEKMTRKQFLKTQLKSKQHFLQQKVVSA